MDDSFTANGTTVLAFFIFMGLNQLICLFALQNSPGNSGPAITLWPSMVAFDVSAMKVSIRFPEVLSFAVTGHLGRIGLVSPE